MMTVSRVYYCFFLGVIVAMSPCVVHAAAHITEATVRDYDENAVQANTVDASAPGSIPVATFTADVATAWDNDLGGVIQFDGATESTPIDGINAVYGINGGKTLRIDAGMGSMWSSGGSVGSGRSAISGDGRLGKNGAPKDFFFDIGPITGGVPGEAVLSIGLTVLSRTNRPIDPMEVIVTFSDSTTASLSDAIIATVDGEDDTFYAFTAPAGLSITNLETANGGATNAFTSIDDLAFITGVPIPEPTSLVLLGFGALGIVTMGRRRVA